MTTGFLCVYRTPTQTPILLTDSASVRDDESDKNPFYHFYEFFFFFPSIIGTGESWIL